MRLYLRILDQLGSFEGAAKTERAMYYLSKVAFSPLVCYVIFDHFGLRSEWYRPGVGF
jgi:hypothetical protein